jgi:hypothetical protein
VAGDVLTVADVIFIPSVLDSYSTSLFMNSLMSHLDLKSPSVRRASSISNPFPSYR